MVVEAKSASDKTDNWPNWMVWSGSLNVTNKVAKSLGIDWPPGTVFSSRKHCEEMATAFNKNGDTTCRI